MHYRCRVIPGVYTLYYDVFCLTTSLYSGDNNIQSLRFVSFRLISGFFVFLALVYKDKHSLEN